MLQVVTGDPKEIADELITNEHAELVTFTGGVCDRQVHRVEGRLPADGARARRQRPDHRHGGRRPRGGGHARRRRLVQELGPALHRDQADAGAALGRRPLRRAAGREDEERGPTATRWTASSTWARWSTRPPRATARTRSTRRWRPAPSCWSATSARGALYSPTVVDHVTQDMPLVLQETFGPVSPVIRFDTIDDAIRLSNSTAFGLSSAVCTNRLD